MKKRAEAANPAEAAQGREAKDRRLGNCEVRELNRIDVPVAVKGPLRKRHLQVQRLPGKGGYVSAEDSIIRAIGQGDVGNGYASK